VTKKWLPSYLILTAIWGCSFYFIKVGLTTFTPAGVALTRQSLGLVTVIVICVLMRTPFPPRRTWGKVFIASLLMTSIPWTLFAFAETHVSSALAGILNGATPLMTLVMILIAFPEEKPTRQRMVGLGIGFVGVLVVVGIWAGLSGGTALGVLACVGAITLYGVSYPFVRRYLTGGPTSAGLHPLTLTVGLLTFGSAESLVLCALTGGVTHAPFTGGVVAAMLTLGMLGSGIAYILNFTVIKNSDATTASTTTYVSTLVSVVVGALVLGETITWNEPVGGVLVVFGAATAQGLISRVRSRRATD